MQRAVQLARRFAPKKTPILLVGPTGSGKELLARHIHAWSGRRGELVDVNCGALPKELVESELFRHRRGSFSGAVETKMGLIEVANLGTLFLDEIGTFRTNQ
jgi:transcriptional regulator with PAS, ATPase and Fis domain